MGPHTARNLVENLGFPTWDGPYMEEEPKCPEGEGLTFDGYIGTDKIFITLYCATGSIYSKEYTR